VRVPPETGVPPLGDVPRAAFPEPGAALLLQAVRVSAMAAETARTLTQRRR
jgi:hypothetical protein